MKSEDNKEQVLALMNGREMSVSEVAVEWGKCKFTSQKTLKGLVDAQVMTVRFVKISGSRTALFKPNGKQYVKKTREEIEAEYVHGTSNNPYGTGEFFNPWSPQIPEGSDKRVMKLLENKGNEYFKQPLRKRGAISIGSTFSLMDGATL